jgi:hypothetical protein
MKKLLQSFILTGLFILFNQTSFAQCSGGVLYLNITPTQNWQTNTLGYGGEYYTFTATAGTTYEFSYCSADGGTSTYDTEITIINNTTLLPVSYNDDFCGLQSRVTYTATTSGVFRVLTNEYPCLSNTTTSTLAYRASAPITNGVDGEMFNVNYPSPYTRIPTSQIQTWNFNGGIIRNAGNVNINSYMKVNVENAFTNALIQTTNSSTVSVPVGTNSTAVSAGSYTPPASVAEYRMEYIAVTTGDVNISNDSLVWNVFVTDSVYARDFGVNTQTLSIGQAGQLGTMYQIFSPVQLKSVSIYLANAANTFNDLITVRLRNFSGLPGTEIANTSFTAQAGFTGWVTVNFSSPVNLNAGSYFIGIDDIIGDVGFGHSSAIYQPNISYFNLGASWQTVESAGFSVVPMFRLNVKPPCPLITSNFTTTPSNCGATTGSAQVSVSGGNAPYTYSWSTGGSTSSVSNLTAGSYTVTVSHSGGCTSSFTVNVPGSPAITIPNPLVIQPLCNGGTGNISVSPSGGTAPFAYQWSNGGTAQTVTAGAGVYTVTVTDINNCTASYSNISIVSPSAVSVSISSSTQPSCGNTDGSATASATGGTGTLNYLWSNGQNTATMSNVGAGTYIVTVTDANGCTSTSSVTLAPPNAPVIGSPQIQSPLCNGGVGSIQITATGGTGTLTYQWSNGTLGQTVTGQAGTYTVVVTDQNNCSVSSAPITMNQPTAINANVNAVGVGCQGGGTAVVAVSGGTPGYTYLWSTGSTQFSVSNLTAGNYSVTITDANGCSTTQSFTITSVSPGTINTTQLTNALCNGQDGSATVDVTGGAAPFTYLWSNGNTNASLSAPAGNYTVTVTDANNCVTSTVITITEPTAITSTFNSVAASCGNSDGSLTVVPSGGTAPYTYLWSTGATNAQLTALPFGSYIVTVTDANNCISSFTGNVQNANAPTVTSSVQDILCNGEMGSIALTITGGTSPYNILWNNGNTSSTISVMAGTYNVTITDASGCQSAAGPFVITEPSALAVTVSSTNESTTGANDGTATATVSGGTPSYTYLWNNGATTSSISNLAAGVYTVTVTDEYGCTSSQTVVVGSSAGWNEPVAMQISIYPNPATDQLFIVLDEQWMGTSFTIVDQTGRIIHNGKFIQSLQEINISAYAKGMYFIHTSESQTILKFVKH